MMRRILSTCLIDDPRFVVRRKMLFISAIMPFLIILILKIAILPFSALILSVTGFRLETYSTVISITFISSIPLFIGIVYAFIFFEENEKQIHFIISLSKEEKKKLLCLRSLISVFFSFITIWLAILITDPVPEEGWLRGIYISSLLSFQSPFMFLFICSFSVNKKIGFILSWLSGIFLVTVPFGLLVHHPLNYFAFFSPFYWISWAWITSLPVESILYGAISAIITFCCIFILFRRIVRKYSI